MVNLPNNHHRTCLPSSLLVLLININKRGVIYWIYIPFYLIDMGGDQSSPDNEANMADLKLTKEEL